MSDNVHRKLKTMIVDAIGDKPDNELLKTLGFVSQPWAKAYRFPFEADAAVPLTKEGRATDEKRTAEGANVSNRNLAMPLAKGVMWSAL